MVFIEESMLNLHCLHFLSLISILPISVDRKNGKIQVIRTGPKFHLWLTYIILSQVHITYSLVTVSAKIYTDKRSTVPLLPLYYLLTFIPQAGLLSGLLNFFKHPDVTTVIFNGSMSNTGEGVPWITSSSRSHHLVVAKRRKFLQLPYVDMLTIALPAFTYPAAVVIWASAAALKLRPVQAEQYAGSLALIIAESMVDAFVILCWMSWFHFTLFHQLLFMGKLSFSLRRLIHKTA